MSKKFSFEFSAHSVISLSAARLLWSCGIAEKNHTRLFFNFHKFSLGCLAHCLLPRWVKSLGPPILLLTKHVFLGCEFIFKVLWVLL